jgi:hypothetical protein
VTTTATSFVRTIMTAPGYSHGYGLRGRGCQTPGQQRAEARHRQPCLWTALGGCSNTMRA